MRLKTIASQKGVTLIELMIAVGLMSLVALLGSTILSNVTKEKVFTENRNLIRQTVSLTQKITNKVGSKVTHTQFDPFNVVSFSNKKIGDAWVDLSYGKSFSGSASSETTRSLELGKLKNIFVKPTNASQQIKTDMTESDLRYLSGCSDCGSCETFLNKSSGAKSLLNAGVDCAPLNSCLFYSVYNSRTRNFDELVSKCDKLPTNSAGYKVLALAVDKFSGAQTSHDLVLSDLSVSDASKTISKANFKSNSVYMSRCVPVDQIQNIGTYVTFEKINLLRRPFIFQNENLTKKTVKQSVNGVVKDVVIDEYNAANIQCCTPPKERGLEWTAPGQCEAIASGENAKYLPTIFVYKGENNVSTWPAPGERFLIPGLAFIMQIDSVNAKSFKLNTLVIENACKSGRRRSSWPCKNKFSGEVDLQYPADGEFNAQLEIKILSKSGSVTSGLSSGGITNLGDSVNYNE
jgi:prepilin-type N-terminal cleavage/methylation domain-containing protein